MAALGHAEPRQRRRWYHLQEPLAKAHSYSGQITAVLMILPCPRACPRQGVGCCGDLTGCGCTKHFSPVTYGQAATESPKLCFSPAGCCFHRSFSIPVLLPHDSADLNPELEDSLCSFCSSQPVLGFKHDERWLRMDGGWAPRSLTHGSKP